MKLTKMLEQENGNLNFNWFLNHWYQNHGLLRFVWINPMSFNYEILTIVLGVMIKSKGIKNK